MCCELIKKYIECNKKGNSLRCFEILEFMERMKCFSKIKHNFHHNRIVRHK